MSVVPIDVAVDMSVNDVVTAVDTAAEQAVLLIVRRSAGQVGTLFQRCEKHRAALSEIGKISSVH